MLKSAFKMIVISYLVIYYLVTSGVVTIHFDFNQFGDSIVQAISKIGEILEKRDLSGSEKKKTLEPKRARLEHNNSRGVNR